MEKPNIDKLTLEQLVDHWTVPIDLKLDVSDPGPSPEPDPLVKDLVYHSSTERVTGFSTDSYILTDLPVQLRPDDTYQICLELSKPEIDPDPMVGNWYCPFSTGFISIMYYNRTPYLTTVDDLYRYDHQCGVGGVDPLRYALFIAHEPGGIFHAHELTPELAKTITNDPATWASLISWIQEDSVITNTICIGNSLFNTAHYYTSAIYAGDLTFIKVNGETIWTLKDEVARKHIKVVQD